MSWAAWSAPPASAAFAASADPSAAGADRRDSEEYYNEMQGHEGRPACLCMWAGRVDRSGGEGTVVGRDIGEGGGYQER